MTVAFIGLGAFGIHHLGIQPGGCFGVLQRCCDVKEASTDSLDVAIGEAGEYLFVDVVHSPLGLSEQGMAGLGEMGLQHPPVRW